MGEGLRGIALPLLLLLTAARLASPSSTPPAAEGRCAIVRPDAKGEPQITDAPDLHVLTQTGPGKNFTLPAATDGASVMCTRAELLPVVNDAEVLLQGYPFTIVEDPGQRMGVLEYSDDKFSFRMMDGKLTPDEEKLLAPRLKQMIEVANRLAK